MMGKGSAFSGGASQLVKVGTAFFLFSLRCTFAHLFISKRSTSNMNLFEQQASEFSGRHIGPGEKEISGMLKTIGVHSLDELVDRTIPASIRSKKPLNIPGPLSE